MPGLVHVHPVLLLAELDADPLLLCCARRGSAAALDVDRLLLTELDVDHLLLLSLAL